MPVAEQQQNVAVPGSGNPPNSGGSFYGGPEPDDSPSITLVTVDFKDAFTDRDSVTLVQPGDRVAIYGNRLNLFSGVLVVDHSGITRHLPLPVGAFDREGKRVVFEFPDYGKEHFKFSFLLESQRPGVKPLRPRYEFEFTDHKETEEEEQAKQEAEKKQKQAEESGSEEKPDPVKMVTEAAGDVLANAVKPFLGSIAAAAASPSANAGSSNGARGTQKSAVPKSNFPESKTAAAMNNNAAPPRVAAGDENENTDDASDSSDEQSDRDAAENEGKDLRRGFLSSVNQTIGGVAEGAAAAAARAEEAVAKAKTGFGLPRDGNPKTEDSSSRPAGGASVQPVGTAATGNEPVSPQGFVAAPGAVFGEGGAPAAASVPGGPEPAAAANIPENSGVPPSGDKKEISDATPDSVDGESAVNNEQSESQRSKEALEEHFYNDSLAYFSAQADLQKLEQSQAAGPAGGSGQGNDSAEKQSAEEKLRAARSAVQVLSQQYLQSAAALSNFEKDKKYSGLVQGVKNRVVLAKPGLAAFVQVSGMANAAAPAEAVSEAGVSGSVSTQAEVSQTAQIQTSGEVSSSTTAATQTEFSASSQSSQEVSARQSASVEVSGDAAVQVQSTGTQEQEDIAAASASSEGSLKSESSVSASAAVNASVSTGQSPATAEPERPDSKASEPVQIMSGEIKQNATLLAEQIVRRFANPEETKPLKQIIREELSLKAGLEHWSPTLAGQTAKYLAGLEPQLSAAQKVLQQVKEGAASVAQAHNALQKNVLPGGAKQVLLDALGQGADEVMDALPPEAQSLIANVKKTDLTTGRLHERAGKGMRLAGQIADITGNAEISEKIGKGQKALEKISPDIDAVYDESIKLKTATTAHERGISRAKQAGNVMKVAGGLARMAGKDDMADVLDDARGTIDIDDTEEMDDSDDMTATGERRKKRKDYKNDPGAWEKKTTEIAEDVEQKIASSQKVQEYIAKGAQAAAKEIEKHPGLLRKIGAGNYASGKMGQAGVNKALGAGASEIGAKGAKYAGSAAGGAVQAALQGEGVKGIAQNAISWVVLDFFLADVWVPLEGLLALAYLDFHYIMSLFGSKWFRKPTIWQQVLIGAANLYHIGMFLLFFLLLLLSICNHPLYHFATLFTGQADMCRYFDARNLGNAIGEKLTASGPSKGGIAPGGSGVCQVITSGPASEAALGQSCFGGNAAQASAIAGAESSGQANSVSKTDVCVDGNPVSFGLFQINITANPIRAVSGLDAFGKNTYTVYLDCPKAFDRMFTGTNKNCHVINQALYQQCVQAATDPNYNIQTACFISQGSAKVPGSNWNPWGANSKCGFH